jgi:hypothetical protein
MDQENYEFLTEKLKYSGFEDKLNARLKEEIKSGKEDFKLPLGMDIEGKKMDVDLYFKKSAISERYFFNKFEANLKNENPDLEPKTHTFYQNQGITAKEAFNLLEGRAVFKSLLDSEKEPYKTWLQLDLSKKDDNKNFHVQQYHEKYGFNLEETLKKFPIKELKDQTKTEWMMKALQKGNTYPVEMEKGGREEIMFIEANPKFKSINVYDVQMNSVKSNELLVKGQENSTSDDKKKVLTESNKGNTKEEIISQEAPKARKGNKI